MLNKNFQQRIQQVNKINKRPDHITDPEKRELFVYTLFKRIDPKLPMVWEQKDFLTICNAFQLLFIDRFNVTIHFELFGNEIKDIELKGAIETVLSKEIDFAAARKEIQEASNLHSLPSNAFLFMLIYMRIYLAKHNVRLNIEKVDKGSLSNEEFIEIGLKKEDSYEIWKISIVDPNKFLLSAQITYFANKLEQIKSARQYEVQEMLHRVGWSPVTES